eukprot:12719279-Ditylum_brightwellii.AAC.1
MMMAMEELEYDSIEDIITMDKKEPVDTVAANMARGTKTSSDSPSNVTVKQVTDFQRGHKRDLT